MPFSQNRNRAVSPDAALFFVLGTGIVENILPGNEFEL